MEKLPNVVVSSYICPEGRIGAEFVALDDYAEPIGDRLYVQGSIEFLVGWVPVLRRTDWDDLNLLFNTLLYDFCKLLEGRDVESGYSAYSLPIRIESVSFDVAKMTVSHREAYFDKRQGAEALLRESQRFASLVERVRNDFEFLSLPQASAMLERILKTRATRA